MRHHWWFPHKSHLLLLLLLPLFIHSRPTAVDFSEVTIFELNDIICICILWSYLRYITIPLFDQSYRLLSLLYKYHFELELDTHAGTLMFTELCLIEFYAHSTPLLFHPRKRLRSIVMSASVCLFVRQDISGTCDETQFSITYLFYAWYPPLL